MHSFDIRVTRALRATFEQADGSSRRGADWVVVLVGRGDEEHQVLVRSYSDDALADQMERVRAFVDELLRSGWSPSDYRRLPGELVVPEGTADGAR